MNLSYSTTFMLFLRFHVSKNTPLLTITPLLKPPSVNPFLKRGSFLQRGGAPRELLPPFHLIAWKMARKEVDEEKAEVEEE